MHPVAAKLVVALVAGSALACGSKSESQAPDAGATSSSGPLLEAADDSETRDAGPQKKGAAKKADERATIAAGKWVAGSTPGDTGRDPVLEPALLAVELSEFSIDRLPYPNDPSKAPLTGASRARAAKLCAERDGRLCSELEWERACEGPDGDLHAGGQRWEPSCAAAPQTCASGFGVLAMGASLREWTASDVQPIRKLQPQAAAVRGTSAKAAAADHRCAHRLAVDPETGSDDLGFRCCYGDANEAVIPSPEWQPTFRKLDMPAKRLETMFTGNKRLAALGKDIKYFRQEAAIKTIMKRGKSRGSDAGAPPENTRMMTAPVLWSPVPGEEILLVTGRSGKDSFIVAFHRLPNDRYRVGAAMIMKDEIGPVVLVGNPYVRRKLEWSTCWQCYGEMGNVRYRDENRVSITQR
jgi:hypothetical protein